VPEGARGDVCLSAFADGEQLFAERYDANLASGTLTFVEGDRASGTLRVAAHLRSGGRILARRAEVLAFAEVGSLMPRRLALERCVVPASPPAGGILGRSSASQIVAADVDGDGRDEVVASGSGAPRAIGVDVDVLVDAPASATVLLGGDLDGDCRDELLALDTRLLLVDDERSGPMPIATPVDAVATGDAGRGTRLAVAGGEGLRWVDPSGATRTLDGGVFTAVALGDLDGDGLDELVALGDATRVWVGGAAGPTLARDVLPPEIGGTAVALADLDGDGALDVVSANGAELRVAMNRGGSFVVGTGATAADAVRRLVALDLDGDCAEDVVALGAAGGVQRFSGGSGGLTGPVALGRARDLTRADVDGDGAPELVILRTSDELERWAP